jgi:hypothetical protein
MLSRLPVDPEGPRHELSARQQPEALARLGLGTQRKLLQASCGAAATRGNVSAEGEARLEPPRPLSGVVFDRPPAGA